MPTGAKSNMRNGSPVICSRICDTMMLGDVPIRVMSPPSSEPKASGISTRDGGFSVLRATWSAIGMKIATAPIFLMKAESAVTADASTATCIPLVVIFGTNGFISVSIEPRAADRGADDEGGADDDDNVAAEAAKGLRRRDNAAGDRCEQGQKRHQVVADPIPDQERDRAEDDGEGHRLIERHVWRCLFPWLPMARATVAQSLHPPYRLAIPIVQFGRLDLA